MTSTLRILRADYTTPIHARDLLALLDAYARVGFAPYALDPAMGHAEFMQKKLAP